MIKKTTAILSRKEYSNLKRKSYKKDKRAGENQLILTEEIFYEFVHGTQLAAICDNKVVTKDALAADILEIELIRIRD